MLFGYRIGVEFLNLTDPVCMARTTDKCSGQYYSSVDM